jgi:hypothetical protein
MDNIERRINEISKLNQEVMKEEAEDESNNQNKNRMNMLLKIQSKIIKYCFFYFLINLIKI